MTGPAAPLSPGERRAFSALVRGWQRDEVPPYRPRGDRLGLLMRLEEMQHEHRRHRDDPRR